MSISPRIRVPASAAAGEPFTIKTKVKHPMETGRRKDNDGNTVPRHVIERFTCEFNGETVIDLVVEGGVSSDPFFEFDAVIDTAGEFVFTWSDATGETYTETKAIELA